MKIFNDLIRKQYSNTKASVITFSSRTELSIKFSDYKNASNFNAAVDGIPLMGYQTRIDKALQQAKTEMFSRQNGARDNVPKILILLTDGSQTGRGSIDPVIPAEELRKTGVFIVVIAIGSQTDMKECKSIAGNNGIYHFVSSFDELISENFIKYVAFSICPGKTVGLLSFHLII